MKITFSTLLAIGALAIVSCDDDTAALQAQQPGIVNPTQFAGIRNAFNYAYGINNSVPALKTVSGNPSAGPGQISVAYGVVTLQDGTNVMPLNANAPIFIGSGPNTEKVTPVAVSCPTPQVYGTCTFTGTFTNVHGPNESITSATFGLQEALNAAASSGGGQAAIDALWRNAGGTDSIYNAAVLTAKTGTIDNSGKPATGGSVTPNVPLAATNNAGVVIPVSSAAAITGLFSGGLQYLKADGTTGTPTGTSLGNNRPVIGSDGSGNPITASAASIAGLFTGSTGVTTYLKSDGSIGTPAGTSLGTSRPVLGSDSGGNAIAATSAGIAGLFSGSTGVATYLKSDGTIGTPAGGTVTPSITLAATNSSGVVTAATLSGVTGLFTGTCDSSHYVTGAGGCVAAPAATIPNYTTSGLPTTGSQGSLAFATDATAQSNYYFYPTSSASPVSLFKPGANGTLAYNVTNGQIDTVSAAVPVLTASNTFSGSNTLGGTTTLNNVTVTGTCTGCSTTGFTNPMTTDGDIITRAGGSPARLGIGGNGQVLSVVSGALAYTSPVLYSSLTQDGSGTLHAANLTGANDPLYVDGNVASTQLTMEFAKNVLGSGYPNSMALYVNAAGNIGMYIRGIEKTWLAYNLTDTALHTDMDLNFSNSGGADGTCDSGHEGNLHFTKHSAGVASKLHQCWADATATYSWKVIF